jgi:hypothetical protein
VPPTILLEDLAEISDQVILDNCVQDYARRDNTRWRYRDDSGREIVYPHPHDGLGEAIGKAQTFGELRAPLLRGELKYARNLQKIIAANPNIWAPKLCWGEYGRFVRHLENVFKYIKERSSRKSGRKEADFRCLINTHKSIRGALRKKGKLPDSEGEIRRFLIENSLHRPRNCRTQKVRNPIAIEASESDAQLVSTALAYSVHSTSEQNYNPRQISIISYDLDIPNLLENFGITFNHGWMSLPTDVQELPIDWDERETITMDPELAQLQFGRPVKVYFLDLEASDIPKKQLRLTEKGEFKIRSRRHSEQLPAQA